MGVGVGVCGVERIMASLEALMKRRSPRPMLIKKCKRYQMMSKLQEEDVGLSQQE